MSSELEQHDIPLAERQEPEELPGPGALARRWLLELGGHFARPVGLLGGLSRSELGPDLRAGITVAVVLIPQAIAYALVAGLPPQTGLYAAIVGVVVGALWGSSKHLSTGPSNATSLLVLATLTPLVAADTPEYVAAAGLLAILAGLIRLVFGVARLGVLVRFVSSSVIVGFTAGAAILIAVNQLGHILRVSVAISPTFYETLGRTLQAVGSTHWPSLVIGAGTVALMVVIQRLRPGWPSALIVLVLAGLAVVVLRLDEAGVAVLGPLRGGVPPVSDLGLFDLSRLSDMATGALAIAAIGLVEAISIARSVATSSGQRLDSDQEFIGQGLANVATGALSGYPVSGSFTRTTIGYVAGGRSALTSLFAGGLVLLATLALSPLATHLPRAALAGVILMTAWSMVDRAEMGEILKASFGDTSIMLSTLVATLVIPLQTAVLLGIAVSFVRYIIKSSRPEVLTVTPDKSFRHLVHDPDQPACPQLGIIAIRGSLYFGAVDFIERAIRDNARRHPEQQFLLLRMHVVDHCDVAGVRMLESVVRFYREERGGDVYMVRVRAPVEHTMALLGFDELLGEEHFLDQDDAIADLFHEVLNPTICVYDCPHRVFAECQAVPKYSALTGGAPGGVQPDEPLISWSPDELADQLTRAADAPDLHVVDVREESEYDQGHIPESLLIPMSRFVDEVGLAGFAEDDTIVLLCRTGRRSARAAYLLKSFDFKSVVTLEGGVLAWKARGLPLAVADRPELVGEVADTC